MDDFSALLKVMAVLGRTIASLEASNEDTAAQLRDALRQLGELQPADDAD